MEIFPIRVTRKNISLSLSVTRCFSPLFFSFFFKQTSLTKYSTRASLTLLPSRARESNLEPLKLEVKLNEILWFLKFQYLEGVQFCLEANDLFRKRERMAGFEVNLREISLLFLFLIHKVGQCGFWTNCFYYYINMERVEATLNI